jgi:hypothetical protein
MNALISTPAKPKETDDHAPTTKHCAIQAMLWVGVRVGFQDGLSVFLLIERAIYEDGSYTSKKHTNTDRYKRETSLRRRKGVWRTLEDIREGCKE